ncbi:peptidoglycan DD-metalloendopeptidase family protein [Desulfovibrio mangrovi]|uniref:peptidoglycan DD-metalloendopeptidase family protein n=1 Tax=Desulfovibrio mangrovi TaxID=2976983 RepID=UPI002247DC37|nr:peptidoglycan DD-metalloendopeptidase family protein [Desulfovibrio mangrovi]UZP67017.1 peptidoglycan DD-metalloendopeptidase family protein [Desulfovibrio mangrovi]
MSSPLDSQVLKAQMSGQDMIRRKQEIDSLRQRLADPNARDKKLREAVEGFEAIFVQKIWQQMRANVPKEGYLHSKDEEFWQGMFDQELSKKLTSAGGIGLSDMLYEQLQNKLGDASRTTAPSRVNAPMPLEPLRAADSPAPAQDRSDNNIYEEDPLYTPLRQEGAEQTGQPQNADKTASAIHPDGLGEDTMPVTDASPEFRSRRAAPPSFSEQDGEAMSRVERLAKTIIHNATEAETLENAYKPSGGGLERPETPAGPVPTRMRSSSGVGGPSTRDPEMGMLNWPLPGRITSDFGWRKDPFTGGREWHAGVDIAADVGDPISAAWDGKVIFAGEHEGYGNLVVLQHEGGWQSYYGHASKLAVEVGDEIRSGRKIAEVGSTGRSTGPHLHFEIRQGELAWNPEQVRNRLLAGLSVGRRS